MRAVPGFWVWSASAALTLVLVLLLSSSQAAAVGHPVTYDPDPPLPFPPCVISSIVPPGTCWIPDLSEVGVEPNPGPVTTSTPSSRKKGKKTGTKTVTIVKPAPKATIKSVIRQAVGPKESIGRRVGGWVGDLAQKAIMAITGFGDYQVRGNTLTNGGSPPAFAAGKHMTKFCHREFVGLVSSPGGAFTTQTFFISPKTSFFPWLSEIALSFEQFIVRGMVVEFKSTSATAVSSTNTALGSVIIATQYNVLAPPFSTQQQMEAYEYCTSTVPAQSMIHPIECAPNLTSIQELYMDSGQNGDPRLEYLGVTYVATVGQQAPSVLGELWVSYEIDMIRPKLFSGIASQGLTAHFKGINLNGIGAILPANQILQLAGAQAVLQAGSDLPVTCSGNNAVFPGWLSGVYQLTMSQTYLCTGAGATINFRTAGIQNGSIVTPGAGGVISFYTGGSSSAQAVPLMFTGGAPHTSLGADSQNVCYTTTFRLTGSNAATPVTLNVVPYDQEVSSGYSLVSCDYLFSQLSVAT